MGNWELPQGFKYLSVQNISMEFTSVHSTDINCALGVYYAGTAPGENFWSLQSLLSSCLALSFLHTGMWLGVVDKA